MSATGRVLLNTPSLNVHAEGIASVLYPRQALASDNDVQVA
jgi:hypothetical protein